MNWKEWTEKGSVDQLAPGDHIQFRTNTRWGSLKDHFGGSVDVWLKDKVSGTVVPKDARRTLINRPVVLVRVKLLESDNCTFTRDVWVDEDQIIAVRFSPGFDL